MCLKDTTFSGNLQLFQSCGSSLCLDTRAGKCGDVAAATVSNVNCVIKLFIHVWVYVIIYMPHLIHTV